MVEKEKVEEKKESAIDVLRKEVKANKERLDELEDRLADCEKALW